MSFHADLSYLLLHAGGPEDASTGSGDSGVEGGSHHSESSEAPQNVFVPGEGVVTEADDRIILRDVPIVTPNLDVVVPKLSLEVSEFASCIQRCTCTYTSHCTCLPVCKLLPPIYTVHIVGPLLPACTHAPSDAWVLPCHICTALCTLVMGSTSSDGRSTTPRPSVCFISIIISVYSYVRLYC